MKRKDTQSGGSKYFDQNTKQELIEVNDIFMYNYREIRKMPPKEIIPPLIHYWMHGWR